MSSSPDLIDTSIPIAMRPTWRVIVDDLDRVAHEHLNEEYRGLLREAATHLARKKPSPLLRGDPASWACGITHAIGAVNFLFDRTQTPHLTGAEIANAFGVSASTGAAKASAVRKALKMHPHDPRWCVPSMLEQHPFIWMLEVDGIVMDIRHAPIEFQRAAFARGLIPFVPGDRNWRPS